MLDIKLIRNDPQEVKKRLASRNIKTSVIDKLLNLDKNKREFQQKLEIIRNEKNEFSSNISKLSEQEKKKKIQNLTDLVKEEEKLEEEIGQTLETFYNLLVELPNLPQTDVKFGKDESENEIIKEEIKPTKFDFKAKTHLELGEKLDLIDVKNAAKVSGSRFGYLKNEAVQLEFALINFAFEFLIKEGFHPVIPPVLIKDEMMQGLGYLGDQGEAETYHFTKDKMYFAGTAEHALIPMRADDIIPAKEIPLRYVGFSTSFRREAGSYGKDTKGILRVHQFDKVEMVSFSKPEESDKEHEYLLSLAEKLVQALNIPYRVVKMCTGDLAYPSARTYDIECWLPSENKYRETHSVSSCTDYQARRLKIRFKSKNGKNELVHTLNGTAFAIGRTLIAILENYQQPDGSIKVPEVLQKHCGFKQIKNEK